jgi:hypothetical protein
MSFNNGDKCPDYIFEKCMVYAKERYRQDDCVPCGKCDLDKCHLCDHCPPTIKKEFIEEFKVIESIKVAKSL